MKQSEMSLKMKKEQVISILLTAAISVGSGIVSGSVIVTTLKNDVTWIKNRLNDQEVRIRDLERRTFHNT